MMPSRARALPARRALPRLHVLGALPRLHVLGALLALCAAPSIAVAVSSDADGARHVCVGGRIVDSASGVVCVAHWRECPRQTGMVGGLDGDGAVEAPVSGCS